MSRLGNNPLFNMNKESEAEPIKEPEKEKAGKGRPRNPDLVRGVSVQEGLTEDYTRATFIVRRDLLDQLKDYAYTERLSLKDAINEALEGFLSDKTDLIKRK